MSNDELNKKLDAVVRAELSKLPGFRPYNLTAERMKALLDEETIKTLEANWAGRVMARTGTVFFPPGIPFWLYQHQDLKRSAKDVLLHLIFHSHQSNFSWLTISKAQLAKAARITQQTLDKAIKQLVASGLIAVEHRKSATNSTQNLSNTYSLEPLWLWFEAETATEPFQKWVKAYSEQANDGQ